MKLIIERNQLMQSIQHVMKAISTRPTIPILSGIKLEDQENEVKLTGSDSDITIESTIPKEEDGIINIHEVTPGKIILQAKFVSEIVRKLPGSQVEIESDDDLNIVIRSGSAEFKLNGQDVEEYPHHASLTDEKHFETRSDVFKNLISQTNFAVSTQETRPILTGVHFILENNHFELVATDSHRLASRKIEIEDSNNLSFRNIVVPGKSLSELNKILEDNQEKVYVNVSDNQILFKTANVSFHSRLLEGNYPETSRLIPDQSKTTVAVSSRELMQAIDRASLLAQDNRNNIVKLEILPDNVLEITSHSPEIGTAEEKVTTTKIDGEDLKISFNAKYMIDALRAIDSEDITISFTGAMRPFIIRPTDAEEVILQLITPVRTY